MSTQRIDRNDKRALLARFKAPSDLPLEVSGIVAEVAPVETQAQELETVA